MPQKMWKHRCPKGGGGLSWSGSPGCDTCGEPGEYDGWHPGMHEAMARYQSKYGLKPIGPHRKMADELLHLDGLGPINDELGRVAGDETLRAMAAILLKQTRGINVVSRHDGGLFAVVLVHTSGAGAQLYVDRIRHALSSATYGHRHPVTARFGVASLPEDRAKTGEDLFRYTDERLRAARPDRRWWRARRVSES